MTKSDQPHAFDLADWCDLARDVAEPAAARALEDELQHNASGRRSVELLQRVFRVAQSDAAAAPPAHAIRVAKAIAGLRRPSPPHAEAPALLRFLPFSVTFDSLLETAQAGLRDLSSAHQRFVSLRAERFTVHVRVEQETDPHSQVVVGQLLDRGAEPRPVSEIPVLVLARGRVVGRSLTSRFGEFQSAGLPPEPLELCLLVDPEECIDVPLGTSSQTA